MPLATVHTWAELQPDHPMPLIERRRIIASQVMLSHVHLAKGFKVPTHAHQNEQLAVVISGRIRFIIDEAGPHPTEHTLTPGQVIELPAMVPHAAEALEDTVVIDVFSPPSEKTGVDA